MAAKQNIFHQILHFLKTDLWRIRRRDLHPANYFLVKHLRIILLAFRDFHYDNCYLKASALTFYTVLSVVPVAAITFGIAKGFGFQHLLERQILERFPGQEEMLRGITNSAHILLDNTRSGLIAIISATVLVWAVVKVLSNIERSFNEIWRIKRSRSFSRKFSDYLAIIIICPLLLIMSGSITVFISTQVKQITDTTPFLGMISPAIYFALKFLPFALLWILFTFIYIFMPNTRVKFFPGFLAGVVAGSLYQLAQSAYIVFQVGAAKFNLIYGSFAALPLFLIWLQISWLIVLFGSEVSFAHQNIDSYEFEPDIKKISPFFKKLLALQIAHLIITNFIQGAPPMSAATISRKLEMPFRLVRHILNEMVDSRIFSETNADKQSDPAYQPARDVNSITVSYILEALEQKGVNFIPIAQTPELQKLTTTLQEFKSLLQQSSANRLIKDI